MSRCERRLNLRSDSNARIFEINRLLRVDHIGGRVEEPSPLLLGGTGSVLVLGEDESVTPRLFVSKCYILLPNVKRLELPKLTDKAR